jgi:hypothetical protein
MRNLANIVRERTAVAEALHNGPNILDISRHFLAQRCQEHSEADTWQALCETAAVQLRYWEGLLPWSPVDMQAI